MDDRRKLAIAIAAVGVAALIVVGYFIFSGNRRPGQPVAGSGQAQPAPQEAPADSATQPPTTGGSREAPGG